PDDGPFLSGGNVPDGAAGADRDRADGMADVRHFRVIDEYGRLTGRQTSVIRQQQPRAADKGPFVRESGARAVSGFQRPMSRPSETPGSMCAHAGRSVSALEPLPVSRLRGTSGSRAH